MGDLILVTGRGGLRRLAPHPQAPGARASGARPRQLRVREPRPGRGRATIRTSSSISGDIGAERDLARAVQGRPRGRRAGGDRRRRGVRPRSGAHDGDQLRVDAPDARRLPRRRRASDSSSPRRAASTAPTGNEFLHEDSHLNPVSLYARTRIMSEDILLNQSRRRGAHPAPGHGLRRVAAHALRPHGEHDDRVRHGAGRRSASPAPSSGGRTSTCRTPPRHSGSRSRRRRPTRTDLQRRLRRPELHRRRDRRAGRAAHSAHADRVRARTATTCAATG